MNERMPCHITDGPQYDDDDHDIGCTCDLCVQFDDNYGRTNMKPKPCDTPTCDGEAYFRDYCGAYVCNECEGHVGLARCYCGWAASGGDGRSELVDMGETIGDGP